MGIFSSHRPRNVAQSYNAKRWVFAGGSRRARQGRSMEAARAAEKPMTEIGNIAPAFRRSALTTFNQGRGSMQRGHASVRRALQSFTKSCP